MIQQSPLGIYLEKMKIVICKDTCTSMFSVALFTIAKTGKQTKCPPTDDWFNMCYIYSRILLCHHKERNTTFAATWMNLENIIQR